MLCQQRQRTCRREVEEEGLDGLRVQQQLLAARLAQLAAPASAMTGSLAQACAGHCHASHCVTASSQDVNAIRLSHSGKVRNGKLTSVLQQTCSSLIILRPREAARAGPAAAHVLCMCDGGMSPIDPLNLIEITSNKQI